ncbi:MAG: LPS-assembly protein LptD [Nitrospirota bacterium]
MKITSLLIILLLSLFSSDLFADDKKEVKEKGLIPSVISEEVINMYADMLEYRKEEDTYHAQGSVVITQGIMRLSADNIMLNKKTGNVAAEGNVDYFDGENLLKGERIELNIDTKEGIAYKGSLFIKEGNYHIKGEELEKLRGDRYSFKKGSFTTCDCEEGHSPSWRFNAKRLKLKVDGYLTAKNLFFYIKDIPIAYLPYIIYPVKRGRQTGLLIPRIGYSTLDGMRVNQAFFWAITKSTDATFFVDYRGRRGTGIGMEYRYLFSRYSGGNILINHFDDRKESRRIWDITYRHTQHYSDNLEGKADVHYVNNRDIFRNLSERTEDRVRQNIESNIFVTKKGFNNHAYFLTRYSENLTIKDDQTLQRLPEIGYSLIDYRLFNVPLFFNLNSSFVNFWRDKGIKGKRIDISPELISNLRLFDIVSITPNAGINDTIYLWEGPIGEGSIENRRETDHRILYNLGIGLDAALYRDYHPFSKENKMRHLIEPSIIYEYIPKVRQDELPQFDTIDRIHGKNAVTYSVTNRIMERDKKNGLIFEPFYFRLTQTYNIDTFSPLSDIRGEMIISPAIPFSIDIDSFYNLYDKDFSVFSSDLKFQLSSIGGGSIGHRYTKAGRLPKKGDIFNPLSLDKNSEERPTTRFLTWNLNITLPLHITFSNYAYYDLFMDKFADIGYRLNYGSQCWGISFSYIDLSDRNQFTFLVTLRGVGAIESAPFIPLFESKKK